MGNRLIVLLAACGLLTLWAYPQIETTYSSWSNEENGWIPFKTIYQRAFLTNVDYGTQPNIRVTSDETLRPVIRRYYVQKQVRMKWLTQLVQSAFIVLVATGLLWAVGANKGPSPDTRSPADAKF
jgi:hypothetical protein